MGILQSVWQMWKKIGQFIGDFIARVILTIFYFTLFLPFGVGVRLFSDPLALKRSTSTHWIERESDDDSLEVARRLS